MEPTYDSNPKVGRAQIPYMNEQRHGEEIFSFSVLLFDLSQHQQPRQIQYQVETK